MSVVLNTYILSELWIIILDACMEWPHGVLCMWFPLVLSSLLIGFFSRANVRARLLSSGRNKHIHLAQGIKKPGQPGVSIYTLQKQVILSTELTPFLRFHIIYGKGTAEMLKKNYWIESKVILDVKKGLRTF